MKQYNFDEIIDRKGTSAYKTDLLKWRFGTDELLPLWVADMDFRTPDFVMDAIRKRCEHEILGYTIRDNAFYQSIIRWIKYKHDWEIDSRWLGFVPGIVPAMAVAVLAFSEPGDKVIVQSPVYPPFFSVVEDNKREVALNELRMVDGQYRMNIPELKKLAADPQTKMMLLCSPHNPGGRVWSKEELDEVAQICAKNKVIVISDEIHADLVLCGYKHIPFATVSEAARQNSVVLMAPSKTFNIAGLGSSSFIIPNQDLFVRFSKQLHALEFGNGSLFAFTATQAAYEKGAEWLKQLITYIEGNVTFVKKYIQENIPQIKIIIPQASFLIWLDFSELELTDKEVETLLVKKAKIGLNPGHTFGKGGEGYHRLNIGCSRLILQEALLRLRIAVTEQLNK
ncbi:MAG: PatB family C-S lyase [Paludibacteraceae bacterium]|nr:PatB family C-S lyase [Paludibacteraceae bacterium]